MNYGMPADYEALARRGIDVKGKIVLARYGGGWRGLKPKLAQEHGAAGCLIYSDPADDGYGKWDSYPRGGGRPADGVQRGSVQDMTTYPGDPLTPGVGATADAKRLTREQATTILKIPALPISYADASKLLAGLEGPLVPEDARGGLPLAYHYGGTAGGECASRGQVRLVAEADLRRDRGDEGQEPPRRVGDPRQPSRRLGVRRRRSAVGPRRDAVRGQGTGRAREEGLAARTHHRLRELGRRGAGPDRIDRMGGNPRRRAQAQGGHLHQHRQ